MVGMVECDFLEGLEQGHDAGWVGGKGRAKEDHSPLLWCAWWSSALCLICTIRHASGCQHRDLSGVTVVLEVAAIVLVLFPQPYMSVRCKSKRVTHWFTRF